MNEWWSVKMDTQRVAEKKCHFQFFHQMWEGSIKDKTFFYQTSTVSQAGAKPPSQIDHFRVPKIPTFKIRPSAQPFLWKWVFMQRRADNQKWPIVHNVSRSVVHCSLPRVRVFFVANFLNTVRGLWPNLRHAWIFQMITMANSGIGFQFKSLWLVKALNLTRYPSQHGGYTNCSLLGGDVKVKKMSCHAILNNLYEPKMNVILIISFKIWIWIWIWNRPTRAKFMCTVVLSSFVCLFSCFQCRRYVQLWNKTIASYTNVYYRNCSDQEMLGVEKIIINYT